MITIHTKNIHLSEEQEEMVHTKVGKLLHLSGRLQDESVKVKVEIDHDPIKDKHKHVFCTVTIFAPGETLRAEVHQGTVDSAIDECESKLRNQIDRYKQKSTH